MKLLELTTNLTAAKDAADKLPVDEYLPIIDTVDGERFAVAGWSRYSARYDADKHDLYLPISMKLFTESTSFVVNHTVHTGIGKIVTFRDQARYVLDPGKKWRSYLAARYGVSRKKYSLVMQSSRVVERFIERATAEETSKVRSLKADLAAAEELLDDMAVERGLIEQEVRALREELRRRPDE
jgi:hypothetical protein